MANDLDHDPIRIFKGQSVITPTISNFTLALPQQGHANQCQMCLHLIHEIPRLDCQRKMRQPHAPPVIRCSPTKMLALGLT